MSERPGGRVAPGFANYPIASSWMRSARKIIGNAFIDNVVEVGKTKNHEVIEDFEFPTLNPPMAIEVERYIASPAIILLQY